MMFQGNPGFKLEGENTQDYEKALAALGLVVEEPDHDENIIWINGSQENLQRIFTGIYNGLDSRVHQDYEVERGWNEVLKGEHLRPGGAFMVTVKSKGTEQPLIMVIVNVNSRDYKPIVDEMHDVVRDSVLSAAKSETPSDNPDKL